MGARAQSEGECEAAAAVYELGAHATIERAHAAGSRALDNAMPNLARPSGARMRAGELDELRAWADRANAPAQRDTSDAALTYAQLCVEGAHGLPRDLPRARAYYERAAAAGEGGASIALGLLELGRAEGADLPAAVAALARGIEKAWNPVEKAMGWSALGQLSLEGRELPRSDAVALRCFREAAASGYLEAFYNLAVMHYAGRGTQRDVAVAAALLGEAAGSGHLPSMQLLGAMTRRGDGVRRDCARAAQLLRPVALRHELVDGAAIAAVAAGVRGSRRRGRAPGRAQARGKAARARDGTVRARCDGGGRLARGHVRGRATLAGRSGGQLEAEGYDEAVWQLLTMRARAELGPRNLAALEGECARAVLRPMQPWAAASSNGMRYAALWAVTAFARWGRWALLWAALSAASSFVSAHLRPSVARDAMARLDRADLASAAAAAAAGSGGLLSREGAPRVFEAVDGALREAGWLVRQRRLT
ncbi:hypothetical protein T492DRAFT_1082886 [Pavlovales sp. CCMP2436]|nr:hypothetical protein T492DRAFT_1082886 [Pavlovales sp. CCMP2436]